MTTANFTLNTQRARKQVATLNYLKENEKLVISDKDTVSTNGQFLQAQPGPASNTLTLEPK